MATSLPELDRPEHDAYQSFMSGDPSEGLAETEKASPALPAVDSNATKIAPDDPRLKIAAPPLPLPDRLEHDAADETATKADPHASKIAPDDPRLKIARRTSRRLRKGPIVATIIALSLAVCIAATIAILPPAASDTDKALESAQSEVPILPDIKNATEQKPPQPPIIPKLGEPLPGNLGPAMVEPAQNPADKAQKKPRHGYYAPSRRRQELLQARKAPLFFSGGAAQPPHQADASETMQTYMAAQKRQLAQLSQAGSGDGSAGLSEPSGEFSPASFDQNKQAQKAAFLQQQASKKHAEYLADALSEPLSPYEVKAGSIIPAVLITGINTDLPGNIIAQVRENVYDTVSGTILLIPQGSRLMATYSSVLTYGQQRVLICWNRLIMPDGHSISLACAPGTDAAGYAGVTDEVNNHYGRLAAGVLLSSVLSASAPIAAGNVSGYHPTWTQQFAAGAADNVNSAGQAWAQKNMNLQPTITVRPGWSLNVLVNKDMILKPY